MNSSVLIQANAPGNFEVCVTYFTENGCAHCCLSGTCTPPPPPCCEPTVLGAHACKPNGQCNLLCPPPSPTSNYCGSGFFGINFGDCDPNISTIDIFMSSGTAFQTGPFMGLSSATNITPSQFWWGGSGQIPICSDACYGQTINILVVINYSDECESDVVEGEIEGGCLCADFSKGQNQEQNQYELKVSPNPLNGSFLNINSIGHFHKNMEIKVIDINSGQTVYHKDYKNQDLEQAQENVEIPNQYRTGILNIQLIVNGEIKSSKLVYQMK